MAICRLPAATCTSGAFGAQLYHRLSSHLAYALAPIPREAGHYSQCRSIPKVGYHEHCRAPDRFVRILKRSHDFFSSSFPSYKTECRDSGFAQHRDVVTEQGLKSKQDALCLFTSLERLFQKEAQILIGGIEGNGYLAIIKWDEGVIVLGTRISIRKKCQPISFKRNGAC